jgi:hypothetical protein
MTTLRRLSDKIIAAHEQACAENKRDVAQLLLQALEVDITAIGGKVEEHRKATEMMEAAFVLHDSLITNA